MLCRSSASSQCIFQHRVGCASGAISRLTSTNIWRVASPHRPLAAALVLSALVFALDLATPGGVAVGVLYVVSMLVLLPSEVPWHCFALAVACTGLAATDIVVGARSAILLDIVLINRGMSVMAVWVVALLLWRRQIQSRVHERERARDAAEQRRLQHEADVLADRLLNAVESSQDVFVVYDASDRILLCNAAARRLLGEGIEGPLVGLRFIEVLDRRLARGVYDLAGEASEAFRAQRLAYHANPAGSLEIRGNDGRTWRITARRTADGGVVETTWDLTQDRTREAELRQARDAADRANAAKSAFLAAMSHELRTPLNAVLGFAQLLQRDKHAPLTERHQGRVAHIVKGGEHLLRLVDELLDLTAIESGRLMLSPEPVEVVGVVDDVVRTLAPMAERAGVRFEVVAGAPLWVRADRTRLSQILLNYGSNAIKDCQPGSRAMLRAAPVGERVRITVTDDGPGIPPPMQANLFQPFYRAGQETGPIGGAGIGLAISKRLAAMMGGSVGFNSELGKGSSFWIELCVPSPGECPVPLIASVAIAPPASRAAGPRREVLYIEDNPENVAFMQELIATIDRLDLASAHTAELGIQLARARRPAVIVLDIKLPGLPGFEALRQLRALPETASIPVVALTASATQRDIEHGLAAGFDRYLTKPVKVDVLITALEEILSAAPQPA
mgnify:CR=1 FL=1